MTGEYKSLGAGFLFDLIGKAILSDHYRFSSVEQFDTSAKGPPNRGVLIHGWTLPWVASLLWAFV
jgi:hypothetical protein